MNTSMAVPRLASSSSACLPLHISPSLSVMNSLKPAVSLSSCRKPASSSHEFCSCKCSHYTNLPPYANPSSHVADKVLKDIQGSGIIACLRAQSSEVAIEAARAALRGGVSALEVVISTPGVFEVVECLVREFPSSAIGVGTVLEVQDAKAAIRAGAKFLMSPAMVKEILDEVARGQALYIPGVMTPTEILFASNAGAKIVKVYPVSALGGSQYIAALRKPFPHIPLVASQGITIDLVEQYIREGASSVVLSDAIFDIKAMSEKKFSIIHQLAGLAASRGNTFVHR